MAVELFLSFGGDLLELVSHQGSTVRQQRAQSQGCGAEEAGGRAVGGPTTVAGDAASQVWS